MAATILSEGHVEGGFAQTPTSNECQASCYNAAEQFDANHT